LGRERAEGTVRDGIDCNSGERSTWITGVLGSTRDDKEERMTENKD
jgi:hypothetical protein